VWTASLAQRLLDGRPVGVAGRDGYSNAAFAPNIASSLGHLVDSQVSSAQEDDRYHHFADLSALRWSAFIARFAEAVGIQPVLAATLPERPRASLRPAIAGTVKTLYGGPIGSLTRRSLALVEANDTMEAAIFATKTALAGGVEVDPFGAPQDRGLLAILSSEHEFRSHLVPGWNRPVRDDEALDRMVRWIVEAGFAAANRVQ
jgi:hypothetical protein